MKTSLHCVGRPAAAPSPPSSDASWSRGSARLSSTATIAAQTWEGEADLCSAAARNTATASGAEPFVEALAAATQVQRRARRPEAATGPALRCCAAAWLSAILSAGRCVRFGPVSMGRASIASIARTAGGFFFLATRTPAHCETRNTRNTCPRDKQTMPPPAPQARPLTAEAAGQGLQLSPAVQGPASAPDERTVRAGRCGRRRGVVVLLPRELTPVPPARAGREVHAAGHRGMV